jgi:hypothetical protein
LDEVAFLSRDLPVGVGKRMALIVKARATATPARNGAFKDVYLCSLTNKSNATTTVLILG